MSDLYAIFAVIASVLISVGLLLCLVINMSAPKGWPARIPAPPPSWNRIPPRSEADREMQKLIDAFSEFDHRALLEQRRQMLLAGKTIEDVEKVKISASKYTHPKAYKAKIDRIFGMQVEWIEDRTTS